LICPQLVAQDQPDADGGRRRERRDGSGTVVTVMPWKGLQVAIAICLDAEFTESLLRGAGK